VLAGARIDVVGGPLADQVFATDGEGRFSLPSVTIGNFSLYFKKRGYEDARFWVKDLPRDARVHRGEHDVYRMHLVTIASRPVT
jgi:hypothetical protein